MRESPYPMISVKDAIATILAQTAPLPVVSVPLAETLGLVLAADVHASAPQPPFPAASVDGFALIAADTDQPRRLIGEQMAGYFAELRVQPGAAVRITTGAPLPAGADAVVKVEQADEADGWVTPHPGQELRPGLGIRPLGSDVRPGERVLAAGQVLGPAELGMLASLGLPGASVHRRPVVGVFSTGDELAEAGQSAGPGQIYDSNRPTLLAAVVHAGGKPLDLGIVRDRPGELEQAVARGLVEADVLVTSGGVSMGELDLLKPLLERWGTVHFGRVLMKPGKPFTFATPCGRRFTGCSGIATPGCPRSLPGWVKICGSTRSGRSTIASPSVAKALFSSLRRPVARPPAVSYRRPAPTACLSWSKPPASCPPARSGRCSCWIICGLPSSRQRKPSVSTATSRHLLAAPRSSFLRKQESIW